MPKEVDEFRYLLEELRVFNRNVGKDNQERKNSSKVLEYYFKKLDKLKLQFNEIRDKFNSKSYVGDLLDKAKLYVTDINAYLEHLNKIFQERHTEIQLLGLPSAIELDSNSSDSETEVKMSEKFELKTASGLIPVMDGSEASTKRLIDAVELYDSLLDNDGKKFLTTYVLKTRLTESAKIRLKQSYTTNALLVADLKSYFIAKKSVSALSLKLNNSKQNSKSIDDFGMSLEKLLVDLTLTQADGNDQNVAILRPINEKIAVNSFANGLNNHDLRTIIKARNYLSLNDAIRGAKDEELSLNNSRPIFSMRSNGHNAYNRGTNRRNYNNNNSRGSFRSSFRGNNNRQFNNNIPQPSYRQPQRFSNPSSFNRGNSNRYGQRGYFMQNANNNQRNVDTDNSNAQSQPNRKFFRGF